MHRVFLRGEIRRSVFLAVHEIHEVLREIGVLRPIFRCELLRPARAHVTQREFAVIMMAEIGPILLNVHLVRVKGIHSRLPPCTCPPMPSRTASPGR